MIKFSHLAEIMDVLFLSIPTLFKVMSRENDCIELVLKSRQILEAMPDDSKIIILRCKLTLFLISLYLNSKTERTSNYRLAKFEFDTVEKEFKKIDDEEKRNAFYSEILFAKMFYEYNEFKRNAQKENVVHTTKSLTYPELDKKL